MPKNQNLLSQLQEDSSGKGELEFPDRVFLKAVNKYRGSIQMLKNKEDQGRSQESTFYLKRRFRDQSTGHESKNIEELVLKDETVFLRGVPGSGKRTETSRILTEWAEGNLLKSIVCCFKISTETKRETSLNQLFWDLPEAPDSFAQFEKLAFEGKLAILFDRVDNLGTMTRDDIKEVTKAAGQPQLHIIKNSCWGICICVCVCRPA